MNKWVNHKEMPGFQPMKGKSTLKKGPAVLDKGKRKNTLPTNPQEKSKRV